MIPDGIRESLLAYRNWFKSFLVKDFMNLPVRYQAQLIKTVEDALLSCKEIHKEAFNIKERMVTLTVDKIEEDTETVRVYGLSTGIIGLVCIKYPRGSRIPSVGKKVIHTVYSLNGEDWFSSKSALIKGHNHV